jgi:hypothetical protein
MGKIRVFIFESLGLLRLINWVLKPTDQVMIRRPEKIKYHYKEK